MGRPTVNIAVVCCFTLFPYKNNSKALCWILVDQQRCSFSCLKSLTTTLCVPAHAPICPYESTTCAWLHPPHLELGSKLTATSSRLLRRQLPMLPVHSKSRAGRRLKARGSTLTFRSASGWDMRSRGQPRAYEYRNLSWMRENPATGPQRQPWEVKARPCEERWAPVHVCAAVQNCHFNAPCHQLELDSCHYCAGRTI